MNRILILSISAIIGLLLPSCADHDDPQLAPIDTSLVKISATVKDAPNTAWLTSSEEMTISVSNIAMTAPKGVVLRSVSLLVNTGTGRWVVDDKPFSGEPMEFKVPLLGMHGRMNFSLRGNIIKQDCRDAEVIIADNIQKIVFPESPELECSALLKISVKGKSTSGEEYTHSFEANSIDHFTIIVPRDELYWQPTTGTAPSLELTLEGSATAWSPNTTFESAISDIAIGQSSAGTNIYHTTIANTPGSLNALMLRQYVFASYFGTWENVTITPYKLTSIFSIVESKE